MGGRTRFTEWNATGLALWLCVFLLFVAFSRIWYGAAQTCCEPPLLHPSTPRFAQGATVTVWIDMTSGFTDDEAFYIEYGFEEWNTQPN